MIRKKRLRTRNHKDSKYEENNCKVTKNADETNNDEIMPLLFLYKKLKLHFTIENKKVSGYYRATIYFFEAKLIIGGPRLKLDSIALSETVEISSLIYRCRAKRK